MEEKGGSSGRVKTVPDRETGIQETSNRGPLFPPKRLEISMEAADLAGSSAAIMAETQRRRFPKWGRGHRVSCKETLVTGRNQLNPVVGGGFPQSRMDVQALKGKNSKWVEGAKTRLQNLVLPNAQPTHKEEGGGKSRQRSGKSSRMKGKSRRRCLNPTDIK